MEDEYLGLQKSLEGTRVVLASASPRRKSLLEQAGISFEVKVARSEEKSEAADPAVYVRELAAHKAQEVFASEEGDVLVVGADTVVVKSGQILGKPRDAEDARAMIRSIAGTDHQVMTGVKLLHRAGETTREASFTEITTVHVYPMTEEEIEAYLQTGEPFDKAGAYGIQGRFGVYVKGIEGDYYNVVGLPIARLYHEMRRLAAKKDNE